MLAAVLWIIGDEVALDVWVLFCAIVIGVVLLSLAARSATPIWYVLVLVTVVVVGESLIGSDSGFGFYLGERLGLEQSSANASLVRRLVIAVALAVPVLAIFPRVPYRLRRVAGTYIGYFVALFAAAVLVDFVSSEDARPVDDLLEGMILSAAAAFSVGVALEIRSRRPFARGARRQGPQ